MTIHRLERKQLIRRPLADVFEFFSRAANLEQITPPWLSFKLLTAEPIDMQVGTHLDYRLRLHGVPLRWRSRIDEWEEGRVFVDRQLRGPYRLWRHRHEFTEAPDGTVVADSVEYALPAGFAGELARRAFVGRDLSRIFDYRYAAVAQILG